MADFQEVYDLYFKDVYKYALSLSRDPQIAEEITQETFFKALKSIDSFRGQCRLYVWLCQIAKNTYITHSQKQRRAAPEMEAPSGESLEERMLIRESASRSTRCSTGCRSPTRRSFPCGSSESCPSPRSGSCSAKQKAGPG